VLPIVNKRKAICCVSQPVSGPEEAYFDEFLGIDVVGPIGAADLRDEILSGLSLGRSSWIRRNRDMRMTMVRKN
jgi:hypothetical protein